MVFIPEFELGILNGWLFFVGYVLVFGATMMRFETAVRTRLYDRSLWTKQQIRLTIIGKLFAFTNIPLFIISPIRFDSPLFAVGAGLWVVGLIGMGMALQNYNNTPLDVPVTTGVYKLSRNPQVFSIWMIFVGICLIIGSGLSLFIMTVSLVFMHTAVLAEEASCLQQYGESYQAFLEDVPRYFLFI